MLAHTSLIYCWWVCTHFECVGVYVWYIDERTLRMRVKVVNRARTTYSSYTYSNICWRSKGIHLEMKIPMLTPKAAAHISIACRRCRRVPALDSRLSPLGAYILGSNNQKHTRSELKQKVNTTKGVRMSKQHICMHKALGLFFTHTRIALRFSLMGSFFEFTSRPIANTADQSTFDACADQS